METENSTEESSGAPHSSNISSSEIDTETASKLRGDAIGDTMYSEVFVVNTLMQFSDLHWSSEVEDNLCFLWDMTEEKDVCQYLLQLSYPALACTAVTNYNEPRFIEIVVGIFANVLCSKCERNITEAEIKTILNLLSSNDPYILIQVMRFVHVVAFMFDKLPFINSDHLDRFNFILDNSTNKELLVVALKALSAITDDCKVDEVLVKGELLSSAITAYKVIKEGGDSDAEFEIFDSQEHHLVVKHLVQFVCNVCSYIDNCKATRLANELNLYQHEFTQEMGKLLHYFTQEKNLLPLDEAVKFYIEALTYIYKTLAVNYTFIIVEPLCKILFHLKREKCDNLEVYFELFCYFVSVAPISSFEKDLKRFPMTQVKDLLRILEKQQFKYEFDYFSNLREIMSRL